MHPEIHSKEEIGETVILEQLLKVLPHDMRVWVKEHEPKDGVTTTLIKEPPLVFSISRPTTATPPEVEKPGTTGTDQVPGVQLGVGEERSGVMQVLQPMA
ncbi:hypothetical protein AAFF_G00225690 [Aldrovandia affinis]|uniref:SCAN box domain-containing protein n=1 Tax=Aldrovandia affinis TaxID=143900 RepID=A0AAD7TCM8_9TELE|nr:hypothetical protein AAFF_G00225690 [Aldrovandia affinis]